MSNITSKKFYYPVSILIWLIFCLSFFMMRTGILHKVDPGTVIDAAEDSVEYVASLQDGQSYLETMENGNVTRAFSVDSYWKNSFIRRVCTSEDAVYILLEADDQNQTDELICEILKLNKKLKPIGKSGRVLLPSTGAISDMSFYEGNLYLTQIEATHQEAYLYLIADSSLVSMDTDIDDVASFDISDVQTVTEDERILSLQYHFGEAVLFTNLHNSSDGRSDTVASAETSLKQASMHFLARVTRYRQFFLLCVLIFIIGLFFILASPVLLNQMNFLAYSYLLYEVFIAVLLAVFAIGSDSISYSLFTLLAFIVISLFGYLIIGRHIRNIHVLENTMEDILNYNEIPQKPPYRMVREFNHLWNCLCDISRMVRKINYRWLDALQVYYRFAPKGIEQVLKKASITEVKSGDNIRIHNSLALIDFHTGTDMSLEQSDDSALKNRQSDMNLLMSHVAEWQEAQKGQLISNTWDMSELVYLFTENCKDTANFGMELRKSLQNRVTIVIHNNEMIYGITGVDKQNIQYVVNAQIREIQDCMADLEKMGLSFVMTGDALACESVKPLNRYIGELKLGCRETPVVLYEILEGMNKYQLELYRETEVLFKRALQYMKTKDFYLAKNEFARMIATHPEDGVAKYYLFLCESFLNDENTESVEFYLNSHK